MKLNIDNFFVILLYLIPIALVSGPFLSDLFLSLIALYGLIKFIKYKKIKIFFKNPIILILSIFYLFVLVNSLLSEYIYNSLQHSLFYFRYIFFIIAIYILLEKNYLQVLKRLSFIIFFTCILVSMDLFIQFIFGFNILGFQMNDNLQGQRFSGLFRDELIAGSYLSRLMPFSILFYFFIDTENKDFKFKIFSILGICLIFSGVLLSGERIATFYSTIFMFFFIILILKNKKTRNVLISILILIFSVFLLTDNNMKKRIINVTIESFNMTTNLESKIIFSPLHHVHYLTAWNLFSDKPFIGHGSKSFRILCDNSKYEEKVKFESFNNGNKYIEEFNGCSTHPHNILLELISENGIVGLLIFYSLYFYILLIFIKSTKDYIFLKKNNNDEIILIFCSLSFLVQFFPLIPSVSFFNNWVSVLNYLPLAIIFLVKKKIFYN